MATIPSYLSWVPKTGTGNAQIKINSVTPYTGRIDRSTKVSGKIVGKTNAVTVTVLEKAADEFITPDSLTMHVAKGGETIHVIGKSNSKILTFTWKTNFGIENVTFFKVYGSTTAVSGTAITGDPGATGEYPYDVTVIVPKNETIKVRSATLEIKGEGASVVKTITITQALGDSYLYLNSQGITTATVTIPKNGGEQTLKVLSNDNWTFEPAEQEASTYTYDLTLNSDNTEIAAKGGTANITAVLKTYRNGNLVSTDDVTPVLSGSATGFSISGTTVTASNRTTTAGNKRAIVVTGKYSNTFDGQTVSSTITIYQEANEASYGALTGGSVSASDIPASGGTSSTSISNMSQTISYTSGSTRAGTVTYSKTDEITVSSLGTTVKARTKVGQVTVTYTGEGGAVANKTTDIYQAENKVTNSNYNPRITAYGTPTVSIGSGLTAAGGSATVSASVTNTETYNALYSSGATGPNQTRSVGGSLSISMTVNGNSRFSLSGNTITHSSMGTNETTDTITIKAVNDGDSSKSATASKSITNSKTVKSTSGGVYTYGNITAGIITNATIPASGGSATATAGNGTQSWNKSATITTYQYTSGSTKDVITEAASSGTNNVAPSVASINATVSSKGTIVSAQTTVKSQVVTWSANGKSASGTMYIYQEANAVIDDNYDEHLSSYGTPEMVIVSNLITAAGGTARVAGVVRNTYTYYDLYTSGSTVPYTRTKAGVYKIEMISNGNNRFSMDDTYLITHSSMGANVTTDTVKFRCYNESDRTKYVDDSISVSNRIESYNYGSWNISISANPTFLPATGGTSTITSSCTRSKTPVYTSGSTGTATTESATPTLAISGAGFTLSGTTVTASKNNVAARTATVTASYSGATSKSVTITQSAGPEWYLT